MRLARQVAYFFLIFAPALVLMVLQAPQKIKRESGENPEQFPLL